MAPTPRCRSWSACLASGSVSDDPWVMYYVVRSGVPFSLERAMASAGAAAVECVERFGADERWRERPRKVALRASFMERRLQLERSSSSPRRSDTA